MARRLTPRELDVMGAVWKLGGATVTEVLDEIQDELAYTTVLTVLRGLEQKGYLTHRQEGRAFRYLPAIEAEEAGRGLLERIVEKVYQGSPVQLVAHLVSERDLTSEEIDKLRGVLENAGARRQGSRRMAAHNKVSDRGRAASSTKDSTEQAGR